MEQILYNAMLSNLQKQIKTNEEELNKLKIIDLKYCKMKVEINKFLTIIENYKSKTILDNNNEVTIYCNGNPYIVLNLAMLAIISNCNMKIDIENNMLGVNKFILTIINNILNKNNLKVKIELCEKSDITDKIIFIDRINDFNILKRKKRNSIFIPYQSIDMYSDSEEFEELFETIYNYALSMDIDIDIFDEDEGLESLLKYGKGRFKLILTKEKDIVQKYKSKYIYVNENPFAVEKIVFDDEIIEKVVNNLSLES